MPSVDFSVTTASLLAPAALVSAVIWRTIPCEPVAAPDFSCTLHQLWLLSAYHSLAETNDSVLLSPFFVKSICDLSATSIGGFFSGTQKFLLFHCQSLCTAS